MDIAKKYEHEKKIMDLMIDIYIKKHPNEKEEMNELRKYAHQKIDKCPFMKEKTFCSKCKVHCYQNKYQQLVKKVMRYSGKWMLLYHPLLAIKHAYYRLQKD